MKGKISIALGVLIIVTVAVVFIERGGSSDVVNDTVKEVSVRNAPPFALEDYEGNVVALQDFTNKIVVINTWATWCPFCVNELPAFKELQQAFPIDVVVVAINRSESLSVAKSYTDTALLTDSLVFLLDPTDSFYTSIGGFSMPETIFVDQGGAIALHKRGPLEFEDMQKIVLDILE